MNCKKGELAVIIKSDPDKQHAIGHICRVVERWQHQFLRHEPAWRIDPVVSGGYDVVLDECLRPIRDPGDDAVDETLVRLGKPVTDEVPA